MRQLLITCAFFATLSLASTANAQFEQQNRVLQFSGVGGRSTASAILARPTVSPYLALTDLTGSGQVDTSRNYFTQVRPQIEAQQRTQQTQRAIANVQRNVSQLRSQAAQRNQAGARRTGHPTRFGYYLQYYPTLNRR